MSFAFEEMDVISLAGDDDAAWLALRDISTNGGM